MKNNNNSTIDNEIIESIKNQQQLYAMNVLKSNINIRDPTDIAFFASMEGMYDIVYYLVNKYNLDDYEYLLSGASQSDNNKLIKYILLLIDENNQQEKIHWSDITFNAAYGNNLELLKFYLSKDNINLDEAVKNAILGALDGFNNNKTKNILLYLLNEYDNVNVDMIKNILMDNMRYYSNDQIKKIMTFLNNL